MFEFLIKKGVKIELAELLVEIADATKEISEVIKVSTAGKTGTKNVFGEEQEAMDVQAEEIMSARLETCPFVGLYGSEERDSFQKTAHAGAYSVFYDPLDGSSLLDVNFSVGTIVGIFESLDVIGLTPADQVCALYVMYGPRTVMMLSVGDSVFEFTLGENSWELSAENVQVGEGSTYFAPGNLRACAENPAYYALIRGYIEQAYTLRYSGGMVPDIHHIFKKGSGMFLYPSCNKNKNGKLRLLYECGPMAYLMEKAGGMASDGEKSILDIEITSATQCTPIFLGSKKEIEKVLDLLNKEQ